MQVKFSFLAVFGLLFRVCLAYSSQYIDEIPSCGLICIAETLPNTACQTAANTTCICTNSNFAALTGICVATNCSVVDALTVERIQAKACGAPVRSRRVDLWGILPVEIFTLLGVIFRFYARYKTRVEFARDDYIMVAIIPVYLGFLVCGGIARYTAFGVDMYTIPDPNTITNGLKLFYICETFYFINLGLCKTMILCFYLRIFPNNNFRIVAYGAIVYVAVFSMIAIFLQIFQCYPVQSYWESWTGEFGSYKCLNINLMAFVVAANLIFQDVFILVLPIPLVIKLNASWRKRAGIVFMFSLGIFVIITSAIRLQYLVTIATTTNPTWDYTDVIVWTSLEVDVSIIVACLPSLRTYLRTKIHMFGSRNAKYGRGYAGSTLESYDRHRESTKSSKNTRQTSQVQLSEISPSTADVDTDHESQIELGDRINGSTMTRIGPVVLRKENRSDSYVDHGIYVKTTIRTWKSDKWSRK